MTELGPIFARLGIEQYLDSFIVEGFDSWETVLDIQEGDLDALNVKLGHRRKLQREIANQRGLLEERPVGSPTTEALGEGGKLSDGSPTPTSQHERTPTETKRKYRRHPKPDKNAPTRSPSAYVIFSNRIREEIRGQSLSFTEIAKLVGDRWQKLSSEEKEQFESEASVAKERFAAELSHYTTTDAYKEYKKYIIDFKAKHSGATFEGKRPRLEADSNSGGGSGKLSEMVAETRPKVPMVHTRDLSLGSVNSTSYRGSASSPIGGTAASPALISHGMSTHRPQISATRPTNSPLMRSSYRESRTSLNLPVHGHVTPEHHQCPNDVPELHPRVGQVSLAQGQIPTNLPTIEAADPGFVQRSSEGLQPPLLHHDSSVSSINQSDSSSASNAPPTTPADEPWRGLATDGKVQSADWPRIYNPLLANNYSAPFGSLPPLQASDRLPDIIRDPSQRTLPLPGSSSPHDHKPPCWALPRIGSPLSPSESGHGSPSRAPNGMNSTLDPSESDAVKALAVLANTGRQGA